MRQLKVILLYSAIVVFATVRLSAQTTAVEDAGRISALGWNWDPLILTSLAIAAFGFAAGLLRMGSDVRARVIGTPRCIAFAAGISALVLALISPLDALDDQLFAAHMAQHLILLMIAPPLLIMGRPGLVWLWAFPRSTRRWIARTWIRTRLREAVRMLMSPVVVWILGGVVLGFWHLPGPFGWAVASEPVHALEHICFFVSALMFWSLVLETSGRRRMDYGATLLFVATFGLQNGLLGALLTFAGHPLYGSYRATTAAWGLTPLEDQQLGGLLMWIPGGLIHLVSLGILFVCWMHESERRARRIVWIATVSIIGLAGCARQEAAPATFRIEGADPSRGPSLIRAYGCGACHVVPGVRGATGEAGPPLTDFGRRAYIAGMLHNEPDNLIFWLRHPQSVVPGNAMPDMKLSQRDARDIAAYLYDSSSR